MIIHNANYGESCKVCGAWEDEKYTIECINTPIFSCIVCGYPPNPNFIPYIGTLHNGIKVLIICECGNY